MVKAFDNETGAYLRTTENINGYYDKLDFKGKKVLTVVASSDHVFEAILRGAKEVDGFDISINSILFYYLKEAAVKSLDYEDYINFFFVENRCFSKEKYEIIRNNLSGKALEYWNKIFNCDREKSLELIKSMLLGRGFYISFLQANIKLSLLSSYLSEYNYNKLKQMINNVKINIKQRDIVDINGIEGMYDYIIFSNIFEYQDNEQFKILIEQYRNFLTQTGSIIVGYVYHDIDIPSYPECDVIEIPSRFMAEGFPGAPCDHIIKTGRR